MIIQKDGSVILTAEEYSDYLMLQKNYEFACKQKETYRKIAELKNHKLIQFFKTRDEVRKETAKEVLLHFKKLCDNLYHPYDLTIDDIWEIADKFGVDVSDE